MCVRHRDLWAKNHGGLHQQSDSMIRENIPYRWFVHYYFYQSLCKGMMMICTSTLGACAALRLVQARSQQATTSCQLAPETGLQYMDCIPVGR